MMCEFNPSTDARDALAMSIVEIAAVAEGVKPFCEGCYTLEGDSCLVLRALSVFERMEEYIDGGYSTPGLEATVDQALPLIEHIKKGHSEQVMAENSEVTEASASLASVTWRLAHSALVSTAPLGVGQAKGGGAP